MLRVTDPVKYCRSLVIWLDLDLWCEFGPTKVNHCEWRSDDTFFRNCVFRASFMFSKYSVLIFIRPWSESFEVKGPINHKENEARRASHVTSHLPISHTLSVLLLRVQHGLCPHPHTISSAAMCALSETTDVHILYCCALVLTRDTDTGGCAVDKFTSNPPESHS